MLGRVRVLHYTSLRWGDAELLQLCRVLKSGALVRLEGLHLCGNRFGDAVRGGRLELRTPFSSATSPARAPASMLWSLSRRRTAPPGGSRRTRKPLGSLSEASRHRPPPSLFIHSRPLPSSPLLPPLPSHSQGLNALAAVVSCGALPLLSQLTTDRPNFVDLRAACEVSERLRLTAMALPAFFAVRAIGGRARGPLPLAGHPSLCITADLSPPSHLRPTSPLPLIYGRPLPSLSFTAGLSPPSHPQARQIGLTKDDKVAANGVRGPVASPPRRTRSNSSDGAHYGASPSSSSSPERAHPLSHRITSPAVVRIPPVTAPVPLAVHAIPPSTTPAAVTTSSRAATDQHGVSDAAEAAGAATIR